MVLYTPNIGAQYFPLRYILGEQSTKTFLEMLCLGIARIFYLYLGALISLRNLALESISANFRDA